MNPQTHCTDCNEPFPTYEWNGITCYRYRSVQRRRDDGRIISVKLCLSCARATTEQAEEKEADPDAYAARQEIEADEMAARMEEEAAWNA